VTTSPGITGSPASEVLFTSKAPTCVIATQSALNPGASGSVTAGAGQFGDPVNAFTKRPSPNSSAAFTVTEYVIVTTWPTFRRGPSTDTRGGAAEEIRVETSGWSSGVYYGRVRASSGGESETELIKIV
jgi:hypothetical protein